MRNTTHATESAPGLSPKARLAFTGLFLVSPFLNVLVSSVLYYVWRGRQPVRARQINRLGWLIFAIQIAAIIGYRKLWPQSPAERVASQIISAGQAQDRELWSHCSGEIRGEVARIEGLLGGPAEAVSTFAPFYEAFARTEPRRLVLVSESGRLVLADVLERDGKPADLAVKLRAIANLLAEIKKALKAETGGPHQG